MTNLSFVCGQVRAQESKLLTVSRLDRMIGAETPEAAFRVMVELQYAEYFDEQTRPEDFSTIINQGLLETKKSLVFGTDDHEGLQFLWQRFDINNLKRALKIKYIETQKDLGDFTESNGFSDLGDLNQEEIQSLIFEDTKPEKLAENIVTVVRNADKILEKNDQAFRFVEFALDQAHFKNLKQITRRTKGAFLKSFLSLIITTVNLRQISRSLFIFKEPIPKAAWIENDSMFFSDFEQMEDGDTFLKWAQKSEFESAFENIAENDTDEEKCVKIEKGIDKYYKNFIAQSVLGEIDTIQIPIAYFERRLQNARLLKFIMFSKFHGMEPEKIYKSLEHF